MPKRIKMHVTKHHKGWQVKKEQGERASAVFDTKSEALERARELAKTQNIDTQVIIHDKTGAIQTEHTYGHDPYPPKG